MCDAIINQKQYILDHVLYEFEMYFETYHGLAIQLFFKNQFQENLLIESHQVHLRLLLDFFYYKKNLPDDIVAGDILANYVLPLRGDDVCKARDVVNKSIAHVTFKRIPPEYRNPAETGDDLTKQTVEYIKKIFPIIKGKINDFLCELKSENIADGLYKQNIQDSLKNNDILHRIDLLKNIIIMTSNPGVNDGVTQIKETGFHTESISRLMGNF